MKVNSKIFGLLCLASILALANSAISQVPADVEVIRHNQKVKLEAAKNQVNELPKSGILSDTRSGRASVAMGGAWGDSGVTSGGSAPISGSVSQIKDTEWSMRVFNDSQDDYRVTVRVLEFGANGRQISAPSFPLSLKAGQSVQRTIRTSSTVKNCSLEMKNWKNLSEEKRKQEQEVAAEEVVAE